MSLETAILVIVGNWNLLSFSWLNCNCALQCLENLELVLKKFVKHNGDVDRASVLLPLLCVIKNVSEIEAVSGVVQTLKYTLKNL